MCSRVTNNFYSWSFVLYVTCPIYSQKYENCIFFGLHMQILRRITKYQQRVKGSIEIVCGWDLAEWFGAFSCQFQSCNSSGFDPSILRHSGIWGAADEAVLNNDHKNRNCSLEALIDSLFLYSFLFAGTCTALCVIFSSCLATPLLSSTLWPTLKNTSSCLATPQPSSTLWPTLKNTSWRQM